MSAELANTRLAVIGAGMAGRRFALRCLAAGYAVVLEDVLPEKLRRAVAEREEQLPGTHFDRLQLVTSVEDAVREADLAIDFVPDELESKLEIFTMLDRMAPPRTILLSPTEALSIADLASCTYRPDRCFGLRQFARMEPGDEVVLAHPPQYSDAALAMTRDVLTSLQLEVRLMQDEMPSLLTHRAERAGL